MKKKLFIIILLFTFVLTLSGCGNSKDAKKFKESYESLNGEKTSTDKEYRNLDIPKKNPIVYTTFEEAIKKMDDKESFIIYVGFKACPWCRSAIPYALETAKNNNIKKIYYIDVRPDGDDRTNDLRGYKKLDENKNIVTDVEPDEYYNKFIDKLGDLLDPYTIIDSDETEYITGENRLFAPTFIMVIKGEPIKIMSGTSSKQTDGYMDITEEMEKEVKEEFNDFYKEFKQKK